MIMYICNKIFLKREINVIILEDKMRVYMIVVYVLEI